MPDALRAALLAWREEKKEISFFGEKNRLSRSESLRSRFWAILIAQNTEPSRSQAEPSRGNTTLRSWKRKDALLLVRVRQFVMCWLAGWWWLWFRQWLLLPCRWDCLRLAVSFAVSDFSWPYWSVCTRLFLYAKSFVLNSLVLSPKYPVVLSFLKIARESCK